MRRHLLAAAIIAALTASAGSCQMLSQTESPEDTTAAAPPFTVFKDETPEYGNQVSFAVAQMGGFDPANALTLSPSVLITYEGLVSEDWTKGPSGSGLTPLATNYTPDEFFAGWLAENWSISDLQNITYSLRQDVHFQNRPPLNGREFTADDVVFSVEYFRSTPRSTWYMSQVQARAVDRYAVQFTLPEPNPYILQTGYNNMFIVAREVVDRYVDLTDWRSVISTAPFYVQSVSQDASITYARNNDYWRTDPFRPANRLPYIGKIQAIVMPDVNLQLAALRSGRIDRMSLSKAQADSMKQTNPDMRLRRVPPYLTNVIHLRTDLKTRPYSNARVRQALSMAIDRQAIARELYQGDAVILNWPFQSSAGSQLYTPLESLPDNLRELYEYNPERAKQLLADAGYPKGFPATIALLTGYAGGEDLYSYVKDYFDAIGVATTLTVSGDSASYFTSLIRHTYPDMSTSAWGNGHPSGAIAASSTGYAYNYSAVSDPYVDQERQAINYIADETLRFARLKELGLYLIEQQYYIELPSPYQYIVWQPWLKGQSGEVVHGSLNNWYGYLKFSWVDSALKQQLTAANLRSP